MDMGTRQESVTSQENEPQTIEIAIGTVFTLRRDEGQKGLILDPRTHGNYFGYVQYQLDSTLRYYWVADEQNGRAKDVGEIVEVLSLEDILKAGKAGVDLYGNPLSLQFLNEIRSRANNLQPRILPIR